MSKRIWERFPKIFELVKADHERGILYGGHDIYHALRVGERALQIALDEWSDNRLAELAGLSGLCHNADRILERELELGIRRGSFSNEDVQMLIERWLAHPDITLSERQQITKAVLGHKGKNDESDSQILIALMDADRVVNLEADLMIRSGQHYHGLPAVDYVHFLANPKATYTNPESVLRDIAYSLDWVDTKTNVCVRTKLGRKLGEERAVFFHTFFEVLKQQLGDVGLMPYPFR